MKLRPLLVLLLFVVSAGILVWVYYAATHGKHTAKNATRTETIADLDACSRRKHVKSAQYDHFAQIAAEERNADAASLFRAMAFSERLGEQNCADAITRLGGSYQPPVKVVVFHSTTDDNLNRSIVFEQTSLDELHGDDIRRALGKGNRYAARVLIWARAGDTRHLWLMKTFRDREPHPQSTSANRHSVPDNDIHRTATLGYRPRLIESGDDADTKDTPARYLVCPVCGNTYTADDFDVFCPTCLTDSRIFIEFQ